MDKKVLLSIFTLILLGLLICKLWYAGPNYSFDDANYIHYGKQMLNGTYNITESPYAYGIAYIGTVALGIKTGNPVYLQIIEYLLLILIIYLIALKYFNKIIAFITALSIELSAFNFVYATRVLPDMMLGLFFSLALLIITYKQDKRWICLAGIFTGFTIFIKLGGFSIVIFAFLAYFLFKDKKSSIYYLYGIMLPIIAYGCLAWLAYHASLFTLLNNYSILQSSLSKAFPLGNIAVFFMLLADYLPSVLFNQTFPLGFAFIFALISSLLVIKKRDNKEMLFYAFILLASIVYLIFGSESFTHYVSITIVSRYFILFDVPIAMLLGYFMQLKFDDKHVIKSLLPFLILLILTNITLWIYF